ncbi:hypothetical protein ARMGADRAFT_1012752 [Armillaria gallica]|uniref:Uncharacterized protein n=1 Tax=Armillaria gallica TaxID=47427 RepID=A0A2H3E046_ARMGA|nr:hypothetical protein ARMGADRAFT_1012752 [Armillaria gallica]
MARPFVDNCRGVDNAFVHSVPSDVDVSLPMYVVVSYLLLCLLHASFMIYIGM